MPFKVGVWEIALLVLLALIIFGAGRLSDLGKGLGEGIRNFKSALKDEKQPEKKS
jgi:sec-independent protein translocase protein TatA